jgi:LysM repeat protein
VRSGETLSQIAARYGTSVSALMHANGLRSANRLRVGQRLRVPERAAQATR